MGSSANSRRGAGARRKGGFWRRFFVLVLVVCAAWTAWVVWNINLVAGQDHAQPADAIAVFGAAEYLGRPSPVLHARLDHAVSLYRRDMAPLIITLGGGSDKDSGNTEGAVGRDYLLANGVPYDQIIAETQSVDTEQQVMQLVTIAQQHDLKHIIVVSDGTHLYRIEKLCEEAGLSVYTSPRPPLGHIDRYDLTMRYVHEVLSYTSFKFNLKASWMHRWLEGKADL